MGRRAAWRGSRHGNEPRSRTRSPCARVSKGSDLRDNSLGYTLSKEEGMVDILLYENIIIQITKQNCIQISMQHTHSRCSPLQTVGGFLRVDRLPNLPSPLVTGYSKECR